MEKTPKLQMDTLRLKASHVLLTADKKYYSVPYRYYSESMKNGSKKIKAEVYYTSDNVEIYFKGERIAVHKRDPEKRYNTNPEHMPQKHQRYLERWNPERINTSIPEHPRHYNLHLLHDATFLEKFISLYDGKGIIVYCKKGGRSWMAANLINDANFTGKIYNMVGGITDWIAQGLSIAPGGILNITVDDVKNLCKDTANGIQIPIDVRLTCLI